MTYSDDCCITPTLRRNKGSWPGCAPNWVSIEYCDWPIETREWDFPGIGNWCCLPIYLFTIYFYLQLTYLYCFFLILPLYIAYECCHSFCFRNRNALLSDVKLYCLNTVGSRDHSPLSAHTVPACWNTSWPARQSGYCGETRKEPPEADLVRDGRKAGKGTESRKICRVLCTNSGPLLFCTLKQLNYF